MMMRPTPAKQRSEGMESVSRKLLYARAASLPPVPIRPRSRENAIEAATSAYGHEGSAMRAGSEAPVVRAASGASRHESRPRTSGSSSASVRRDGGERERERSLGPVDTVASSKAQRLLGALQLEDELPPAVPAKNRARRSFAYSDVSDDDDDDGASFVDFGVDEPRSSKSQSKSQSQVARLRSENQRRPLSITSVDSGIPAFAPPSPPPRDRSPPSPTAFIRTFSSSAHVLMSAPPSSTAVASAKPAPPVRRPNAATPPPSEPLPLPPTTNTLSGPDRAELLRRHRKLAQVLGDAVASAHPFATAEPVDGPWPPARDTVYMSAAGRRHSSPLSPSGQFDFLRSIDESASLATMAKQHTGRGSPTSFVDMDDDDKPPRDSADAISIASSHHDPDDATPPTPKAKARKGTFSSSYSVDSISSASTSSPPQRRTHRARSISIDVVTSPPGAPGWVLVAQGGVARPHVPALSDEERRRKRAKLVKLHRFLGSRVPTDLVLGLPPPTSNLPPVAPGLSPVEDDATRDGLKGWIRRKRGSGSGSGAASPVSLADPEDSPLNATELGDRERMINVKRAQKMEKLFGAPPPQTLFHTRTAIPGQRPFGSAGTVRSPSNAAAVGSSRGVPGLPASAPSSPRHSVLQLPPTPHARPWSRANSVLPGRPSTSESSQGLLRASLEEQEADFAFGSEEDATTPMAPRPPPAGSPEFRHYQQSLSSLGAIIDRGDRESLMELFDYVNEGGSSEEEQQHGQPAAPAVSSSSVERRRSLPPTRASVSSASSIMSSSPSAGSINADPSFGVRRRRAAKLAHFFGVSYRDLVGDVLDSIEMGLRDEASKGSMKPDEVQELITRLQILKNRGTDLDSRLQRTR